MKCAGNDMQFHRYARPGEAARIFEAFIQKQIERAYRDIGRRQAGKVTRAGRSSGLVNPVAAGIGA